MHTLSERINNGVAVFYAVQIPDLRDTRVEQFIEPNTSTLLHY